MTNNIQNIHYFPTVLFALLSNSLDTTIEGVSYLTHVEARCSHNSVFLLKMVLVVTKMPRGDGKSLDGKAARDHQYST